VSTFEPDESVPLCLTGHVAVAEMMRKLERNEVVGPEALPSPPTERPEVSDSEVETVLEEIPSPLEPGEGGTAELPSASSDSSSAVDTATPQDPNVQQNAVDLGAMGRGLIDSLGGLHDAAVFAAELYIAKAMAQVQAENPEMSGIEVIEEVLPGFQTQQSEDARLVLQMDINLKKFPCVVAPSLSLFLL
jgi:hypothetical protein